MIFSNEKKTTIKRIAILMIVFAISFGMANYNSGNKYSKELSSSKEEVTNLVSNNDSFGTYRMKIWKRSLDIILDYPLFGVGPDSMAKLKADKRYISEDEQDYLNRVIVDKAHSEPLHIAVTTGIPSAIVYLIIVAIIGIRLLTFVIKASKEKGIYSKEIQYAIMVLICFASYLVQSLINISVIGVAPMFWAILGNAAGITENEKISTL